jgi:hypothetical protein
MMSRMLPDFVDADPDGQTVPVDARVREEPEDDDEDEEDDDDKKEDQDDDDGNSDGYSE